MRADAPLPVSGRRAASSSAAWTSPAPSSERRRATTPWPGWPGLAERRQRDGRQAGVGVYLESSTRANVPLDERLEFRETGPVTAYGTEDLTGMWWVA